MSAVLEVEGVSKTFTRTKALSRVAMTIDPARFTPSGAEWIGENEP